MSVGAGNISDMEEDIADVASPTQGTSLQRSPLSQGGSPAPKKPKPSPNPAPVARDAIKWIRHTLQEQSTKRSAMTVELQRNTFEMLSTLDAAVHDLVISNLQLKSQLEESRRSSEMCVSAAVAQFGVEIRLREAAHEQTLEAVVARYAEKEASRATEHTVETHQIRTAEPVEPATYARAVRVSRPEKTNEQRSADRSRSRLARRAKLLSEQKKEEHMPSFTLQQCDGKSTAAVRDIILGQVVAKNVKPKCQLVTTKAGKVILRPVNRETADALKHLSRCSSLVKEDTLRWPRVIVRGVASDADLGFAQRDILSQNEELDIPADTEEKVLNPVFKSGPRDRDVTNWVVEVNPKYYSKFEDTTIYLGFMRCRVRAYDEVTQCHLCLRYGHPASKCNEKECTCSHCGRKGHKADACPAAEADPTCSNCRGRHNARDKTCSTRTSYLVGMAKRTDYGAAQ